MTKPPYVSRGSLEVSQKRSFSRQPKTLALRVCCRFGPFSEIQSARWQERSRAQRIRPRALQRNTWRFFLFWRLLYYAQLLQHAEFVHLLPQFHDLATFDPEEVKTRYRYRPTSRGNAHQLPLLGAP